MANIDFQQACRDCFRCDGTTHRIKIDDDIFNINNHTTEYNVMSYIEDCSLEAPYYCFNCNSTNLEFINIKLNNENLFDYSVITEYCKNSNSCYYNINIKKEGNRYQIEIGGKIIIDKISHELFVDKIIQTVKLRPDDNFENKIFGNFFISVLGKLDSTDIDSIFVERLTTVGLTRYQIYGALKKIIGDNLLDIEIKDELTYNNSSPLEGEIFKGALFNNFIYFDDDDQELPFSCVYFDYNNEIIIAADCKDDSPINFMNKNLHVNFFIENETKPIYRNDKNIYFAKVKKV